MKTEELPKVESNMVRMCENTIESRKDTTKGIIVQVPVILTGFKIQTHLNFSLEMPYWVSGIKETTDRVKIIQSKLIHKEKLLFVKGFIKKRIYYFSYLNSKVIGAQGDILCYSFDVPFEIAVNIDKILSSTESKEQTSENRNLSESVTIVTKDEKLDLLSSSSNYFCGITTEFYHKTPYCEIVSGMIVNKNEQKYITKSDSINMPLGIKENIKLENIMDICINGLILKEGEFVIAKEKLTIME